MGDQIVGRWYWELESIRGVGWGDQDAGGRGAQRQGEGGRKDCCAEEGQGTRRMGAAVQGSQIKGGGVRRDVEG